jgi:hypothetical protein
MERSFINLTPLIPLSFEGEGEEVFKRGAPSLSISLNSIGVIRELLDNTFKKSSLPLVREGGQGDRLLNDLDGD